MAELLHALRRWWWGHFGGFARYLDSRCADCGVVLNAAEREYYEVNCERCEAIYWQRFEQMEREHFGDFHKETGIYAAKDSNG